MEIYPSSAFQNSRGNFGAATGPSRGPTKDPYAGYTPKAPETPKSLPAGSPKVDAAARQLAAQEAASRQTEARMAELKALVGTSTGTSTGTSPAPAAQIITGGDPNASSPKRGFALYPEDAWLARLGFCADNWLDCSPDRRMRYLQQAGCQPSQLNAVLNALDAWCSRRTGR